MRQPLYDDTHVGPRFTYGLTFRPLGYAHVPDGYIIASNREHPDFRHGTVDYPEPLSQERADAFELTLILPPDPAREAAVADIKAEYRRLMHLHCPMAEYTLAVDALNTMIERHGFDLDTTQRALGTGTFK